MIVKHENFKNNIEVSQVDVVNQTDMTDPENPVSVQHLNGVVCIVITDVNGEEYGIALEGYAGGNLGEFINSELDKLAV